MEKTRLVQRLQDEMQVMMEDALLRQGSSGTPSSKHAASEQSSRSGARPSQRQNHREDAQSAGSGPGGYQAGRGVDGRGEGGEGRDAGWRGEGDDRLRVELGRQEGVAMEARATAAAAQQVRRNRGARSCQRHGRRTCRIHKWSRWCTFRGMVGAKS